MIGKIIALVFLLLPLAGSIYLLFWKKKIEIPIYLKALLVFVILILVIALALFIFTVKVKS
jgi:hypothetical protein